MFLPPRVNSQIADSPISGAVECFYRCATVGTLGGLVYQTTFLLPPQSAGAALARATPPLLALQRASRAARVAGRSLFCGVAFGAWNFLTASSLCFLEHHLFRGQQGGGVVNLGHAAGLYSGAICAMGHQILRREKDPRKLAFFSLASAFLVGAADWAQQEGGGGGGSGWVWWPGLAFWPLFWPSESNGAHARCEERDRNDAGPGDSARRGRAVQAEPSLKAPSFEV